MTKVRVCDLCNSPDDVRQYRVDYLERSRRLTTDLCAEHSSVLEEVADKLPARRGPRANKPVVTKEEIASQRTKKAPAKKAGASRKRS